MIYTKNIREKVNEMLEREKTCEKMRIVYNSIENSIVVHFKKAKKAN